MGPLTTHGPAATRRRYSRALLPAAALACVPLALAVTGSGPWWLLAAAVVLLVAVALAADRARSLGHDHAGGHVVARSGSIVRRRDVLADGHVIGWTWRSTWWQRRVGLTTLSATTAGGPQRVDLLDVPESQSVVLALAVLPDVVGQFLPGGDRGSVGPRPTRLLGPGSAAE